MQRFSSLLVWATLSVCVCLACSVALAEPGRTVRTYHGIRPTDKGGRLGLRNPHRGFRTVNVIGEPIGATHLGHLSPPAHLHHLREGGYRDDWWLLDAQKHADEGLTLVQGFIYLDQFVDRPLSEQKLADIQRSFDAARAAGLKFVLRIAYEKDTLNVPGPTLETILGHLEQLAPLLQRNSDLLHVMQAGCIGAWGEWHHSANKLEDAPANLATVVARLLEILPSDVAVQVRRPQFKTILLAQDVFRASPALSAETAWTDAPAARIGFHNDGFLAGPTDGNTWPEPPCFGSPGNEHFDRMTEQSPYVPVDGEMFVRDLGGPVDGLLAATRMRLHHYASFSISHSSQAHDGNEKLYAIDRWRKTPLTAEQLHERKLPVSDGYFEDAAGLPVPRTQFEYIRDHLGYRHELQAAEWDAVLRAGKPWSLAFEVINRGFAVLPRPRAVKVVLLDDAGRIAWSQDCPTDVRSWQPYAPGDETYQPRAHRIKLTVKAPPTLSPGQYRVGLWLPDPSPRLAADSRYAVRFANRDVPWLTGEKNNQGVNLLGTLTVQ